jgi:hypothetical protein
MRALSKISPVLAACILLVPVTTARAAEQDFRGTGNVTVVSVDPVEEGYFYTFTVDGQSDPFGDFTGSGSFFLGTPSGIILAGDLTLVNDAGDALQIDFYGQSFDNGLFVVYFNILGGAGAYEGATGEGYLLGDLAQDPAPIAFDGYIQRP